MGAAKSGNDIVITGSGNTLSSIVTDIDDTAFIEVTQETPLIVTMHCSVLRRLYINNTGELTIGDAGDYSVEETLEIECDVDTYGRIIVNAGGHLKMYGNTTLDFGAGVGRPYYNYFYGAVTILGNDTYKPLIIGYRENRFYEAQQNDTYQSDIWNIQKARFGGSWTGSTYYAIYFTAISRMRQHTFKDITFDKDLGSSGGNIYPFYIPYFTPGMQKLVFENMDFEDCNYGVYAVGGNVHIKNCIYGDGTSWKQYFSRRSAPDRVSGYYDYGYQLSDANFGQNFDFIEGCTFENVGSTKNCIISEYSAQVFVKNCEFQIASAGDCYEVNYSGRILLGSGNTYTGGREVYDCNTSGYIQWVYELDLTICDSTGSSIEDAIVYITQKDSKEAFIFRTKSNGKLNQAWDIEAALLTWKHQYGDNKSTNYEYWSDSSNSTYHTVTVFKDGYYPYTENFVMDQDREVTIYLDSYGVMPLAIESFDAAHGDWIEVGDSPYLDTIDFPSSYIYTETKDVSSGMYGVEDATPGKSLQKTYAAIYCKGKDYNIEVYIHDGSSEHLAGTITPSLNWGWVSIDVSDILDTEEKINAAKIRFKSILP